MKGSHTAPPASWRSRTPNKRARGTAIASGGRPIAPIPPADPPPPDPPTPVPLPPDPADGPPEPPAGKDDDGEALGEPAPDREGVTATDPRGDAEPGTTLPDADGDPGPEGMGSDGSGSVGIGNVGSGTDGSGSEGNGTEGSANGCSPTLRPLTGPPAVARPRAS